MRAQGAGVRDIVGSAPESPVDCLARAASQRGDSERRVWSIGRRRRSGTAARRAKRPKIAKLAANASAEKLLCRTPPRRHR